MVAVTSRAKETLARLKESTTREDPDVALRLAPGTTGELELFPDRPKPGGQVVGHVGEPVLLIDREFAESLTGTKIDCQTSSRGTRIVLRATEAPDLVAPDDEEDDDGEALAS
jgi:hypothetical protein